MRKMKIVADSSANLLSLQQVPFASAPLKVIAAQREFVDDSNLNVEEMVAFFDSYKGKSKTSCPNPGDWLEAFGDADDIFCVTITSGLSGSYNAACVAKEMYEAENAGKRVFVIDSLSAGPELALIIEKLQELIATGKSYEEICEAIGQYTQKNRSALCAGILAELCRQRQSAYGGGKNRRCPWHPGGWQSQRSGYTPAAG